jgi:hypothetical protein
MLQVLGSAGHIGSPAQLLPLLVGVMGFLRVVWLIFVDWNETFKVHSQTGREGRTGFWSFIPSFEYIKQHYKKSDDTDLGALEIGDQKIEIKKSMAARFALTWLPWLAEFVHHKHTTADGEAGPDKTVGDKLASKLAVVEKKDSVSSAADEVIQV